MSTVFTWSVVQMERLTSDNYVVTVHYNVSAVDGEYQSSTYGTVSYTQEAGQDVIPYQDLTEEIVVGWCQTSLGKDTVENSLQSQIDAQKNPVQESGTPWSAAA